MTERRDRGFTLVEVVVTVSLIALVAVALGAAFTVIVRTTPTAEDRVDDAGSMLSLTSWLPRDVQSADLSLFDPAPYPDGCSGVAGGDLMQLRWADGFSTFTVDYRFVDGAPDLGTVVRYSCVNGQPATSVELTAPLKRIAGAPPVTVTPITGGAGTEGIGFTIEVLDGEGTPRTLVDLDLYSTNRSTPAPTTTTPGVTTSSSVNLPPHAADIWVTVPPGAGLFITLPATDVDGPPPDIVPPVVPPDPDIFITPHPIFTLDVFVDVPLVTSLPRSNVPFTYEVVDDDGATATGTIFVTIGGTTPATSTTTSTIAPVPCSASLAVSPSGVGLDDAGRLDGPVTLTVTRNGFCHPLVVAFDPDTTDLDQTLVEVPVEGYATVTIGADDHIWRHSGTAPWNVPILLREGSNGTVHDTDTLTVGP